MFKILRNGLLFGENVIGTLASPYNTYFRISKYETVWQGIAILLLAPLYGLLSSIVRNGLFRSNFLTLGVSFLNTTFAIMITFLLASFCFMAIGRFLKVRVNIKAVFNLWAFSYVPTYLWFAVTAVLYFLLPPPRTTSFLGASFSVVFVGFSTFLLLWKLLLYYLTIRIGLKISLGKIVLVSAVLLPVFGLFSLLSYKLGIYRIPFV